MAPVSKTSTKKVSRASGSKTSSKKEKTTEGSKRNSKRADPESESDEKPKRSFRAIDIDGQTYGRYTGKNPKQAASKAYSKKLQYLAKNDPAALKKIKGGNVITPIFVRESTRGFRRKVFGYEVQRINLEEASIAKVMVKDKDGNYILKKNGKTILKKEITEADKKHVLKKKIKYHHKNNIRKIDALPKSLLSENQAGGSRKKADESAKKKKKTEKNEKNEKNEKTSTRSPAKKASGSKTPAKKASGSKKTVAKKATRSN